MLVLAMEFSRSLADTGASREIRRGRDTSEEGPKTLPGVRILPQNGTEVPGFHAFPLGGTRPTTGGGAQKPNSQCINWELSSPERERQ